jgi:beta-glucanase (GH16 family)
MRPEIPVALATVLSVTAVTTRSQTPEVGPKPVTCHATPTDPAINKLHLNPALSDEFDTDRLDAGKWHGTNPWWNGRPPGRFDVRQATVEQGHLTLSVTRNDTGSHRYSTGAVVSRQRVLYGYYELRARTAPAAVTSAFWFYRDEPSLWTEIDVFENTGHPRYSRSSHTNAHVFRLPGIPWTTVEAGQSIPLLFDTAATWGIYGLHWTATHLDFYINGCRVRRHRNTLWHQPLHAVLDIELMPDWLGLPDEATLPAHYRVDYFRVWQ